MSTEHYNSLKLSSTYGDDLDFVWGMAKELYSREPLRIRTWNRITYYTRSNYLNAAWEVITRTREYDAAKEGLPVMEPIFAGPHERLIAWSKARALDKEK